MGKLSPAEGTEGSAESEEVKQSDFRFHIEVIILFALNMYVQDLGLERRKMASFEKYIQRRNIIMTKVRKIVAAIMVVTTLATSAVCNLTASAAPNVVSDSYGAFEWESSNAAYAKTTNLCSSGTRTTSASITVYKDKSFEFITKVPPVAVLIKKSIKIEKGSGKPNKDKVAKITKEQVKAIAEQKMPDLNAASLETAMSMVEGTARSMGVVVVD